MTPGDGRRIEHDLDVGIASDHMFTGRQRNASAFRFDPAQHVSAGLCTRNWLHNARSAERVSETVHGPHESGSAGRITQSFSNLCDEIREISLYDVSVGPQKFLKRRLGHNIRPGEDKRREELKCFRREVNLTILTRELPGIQIQREWVKANSHPLGLLRRHCMRSAWADVQATASLKSHFPEH